MQDIKINVPVPPGTTLLSTDAPALFTTNFDGQELSFSTIELARNAEIEPLSFKVSVGEITDAYVVTHAWATWKNVGRQVGTTIVFQEDIRTGDIIVQPFSAQQVVSDVTGDVPFANYDIASIALQNIGPNLKINYHIAGDMGAASDPLEFHFYIDKDCNADTGQPRGSYGVDYWVRYRHEQGQADLRLWDEKWTDSTPINSVVNQQLLTLWIPSELLKIHNEQFCWLAEARNGTTAFSPNPPRDIVPNSNISAVTRYEVIETTLPENDTDTGESLAKPVKIKEEYLIKPGEN